MTAPAAPSGLDLSGAYFAQQAATRTSVLAMLAQLWARLTSWRGPDAARFAAQAAPLVTGGQQATAALTGTWLRSAITAGGGAPAPGALPALDDAALRGVPAGEVYQRPFRQLWWDLSRDVPLDQAVQSAGQRVQSLAASDLQLAKTHTARQVLNGAGGVSGYRRVLTGDRSCALCVLAATRTYRKAELLPIHPGCDCAVAPLFGGEQAPDVAADLHDAIRDTLGPRYVSASGRTAAQDYRDLVVVHRHGELGEVLAVRGQGFTGPADVPGGR